MANLLPWLTNLQPKPQPQPQPANPYPNVDAGVQQQIMSGTHLNPQQKQQVLQNLNNGAPKPFNPFLATAQTVGDQAKQIATSALSTGAKDANTVLAGTSGLLGLGNVAYQRAFGTPQNYQQAINSTSRVVNGFLTHGIGNQGSYLTPQQAAARGGGFPSLANNFLKPAAQAVTANAPYVIPVGGLGAGASLPARMAIQAAVNAPIGAASSAAQQALDTGRVDPTQVVRDALVSGAIGGVAPVLGAAARAGTKAISSSIARAAESAKPGAAPVAHTAEAAPAVDPFKEQLQAAQAKLDQLHQINAATEKLANRVHQAGQLTQEAGAPSSATPNFVKLVDQNLALPKAELARATRQDPLIHNPQAGFIQIANDKPTAPVEQPAAPKAPGAKQAKFTESVQNSPEVSPKVAAEIKRDPANYETTSNAEHLANSEYYVTKNGITKAGNDIMTRLSVPLGKIDHQTVSDAIATAKALDARGKPADLQRATDIYNSLGEHLSKQGQAIQAASLLSNRTPEGLQYGALREMKKGGVNVTPELQKTVKGLTDAVRSTAPGSAARQLAISKLVHFVNDKLPRSKKEAAVGIWRAGLLTGPETATKVAFSHAITLPFEAAAQLPTAVADRAISLITGKRATMATLRGAEQGIGQGTRDFLYKMKTGIDAPGSGGEIPDFGATKHQTPYENFVGNLHGGLFKPAYEGRYQISLNDQALTEAHNLGLKGAEREAYVRNFVLHPSDQAKEIANFDAARATNQQPTDLGNMAQSLSHLTMAGIPVGRILAPFTRIPSAIGTTGIVDYTPLGIGREIVSQVKAGQFNQRLMSQAIGRAATGTAIAGLGALLMSNGRMTLKAPNDAKDRALWDAEGKQANSIYFGGTVTKNSDGTFTYKGGQWISLNPFGAIGITMGIGGAFGRALMDGQKDPKKATLDAIQGGAGLLLDQPYFKGVSGAANALSDPTRYAQTFLDNTIGSIIPTGITQTARGTDPLQRTYPTNPVTTLQSEIPGLREQLPAKQDPYGNELPGAGGSAGSDINGVLNPFYPQAARNQGDPVTQELQRLYDTLGSSTSPNIALPGKNLTINGQKVTMTPQQLHDYIAGSGPVLQQGIANLIQNPQYQQLTDEQKSNEINKVITAAHMAQQISQFDQHPKSLTATERIALSNPGSLGSVISTPNTATDPAAKYQADLLKYQQQKAAGQLSPLQDYKAQATLAKEQITAAFPTDVTSLYGMSKAQIGAYLKANPSTAAQTYQQLQQLDQQLYQSGISSSLKFRNGLSTTTRSATGRLTVSRSKKLSLPRVARAKLKAPRAPSIRLARAKQPKFRTSRRVPSLALKTPKVSKRLA